jgi:hypothetical protein
MKRCLALVLFLAACGGKSAPTETAPLPQGPTCKDIGDRAAKDIDEDLPPAAPQDFGTKFGAMITQVCTDDAWPQEVISCGMTAEDPRKECSPKLSEAQRKHLDAEQTRMQGELVAAMSADVGTDLTAPTGMANCDKLRNQAVVIQGCTAAITAIGEAYDQVIASLAMLSQVPANQKAQVDEQCKTGITEFAQLIAENNCTGEAD